MAPQSYKNKIDDKNFFLGKHESNISKMKVYIEKSTANQNPINELTKCISCFIL